MAAVSFVPPAAANALYQAAQRAGAGAGADAAAMAATVGTAPGTATFANALASAMNDATGTIRAGEAAAQQGAAGQGDLVQVINAVTAAELTLETVVAIRDKVIAAYQDIMRMPI